MPNKCGTLQVFIQIQKAPGPILSPNGSHNCMALLGEGEELGECLPEPAESDRALGSPPLISVHLAEVRTDSTRREFHVKGCQVLFACA